MTLFALIKGNTTFKEIFIWMTYNENNDILKQIFEKEKLKIPSKCTLHSLLVNTDNNVKKIKEIYEWETIIDQYEKFLKKTVSE